MAIPLRSVVVACLLLAGVLQLGSIAGDTWNWDEQWEPAPEPVVPADDPFFPRLTDAVFELPHAILSLQTHGSYFGSGDEFLVGGVQVDGIGGGGHSFNLPSGAIHPEMLRLLGADDELTGLLWGTPESMRDRLANRGAEQQDPEPADSRKGSKSKVRWLRYEGD